jgi:hypothetical protein
MDKGQALNGPASALDGWLRGWIHFWEDLEAVRPIDTAIEADRWPHVSASLLRYPIELHQLLETIGVDIRNQRLHPDKLRQLKEHCASCRSWRVCRRAYHDGSLRKRHASICPNAAQLRGGWIDE